MDHPDAPHILSTPSTRGTWTSGTPSIFVPEEEYDIQLDYDNWTEEDWQLNQKAKNGLDPVTEDQLYHAARQRAHEEAKTEGATKQGGTDADTEEEFEGLDEVERACEEAMRRIR
ncbi:MAG: hypothetical protein L6R40_006835, partial [Gallowayella cf. fulva]